MPEMHITLPTHHVSVSVVITDADNKILLIDGITRGWEMPGGLVEDGESLISALHREVYEESGAYIDNIIYKGFFHNLKTNTFNFLFTGRYSHGNLRISDECRSVGFYSIEEVKKKVVWGNFWQRIQLALSSSSFAVEFDEVNSYQLF